MLHNYTIVQNIFCILEMNTELKTKSEVKATSLVTGAVHALARMSDNLVTVVRYSQDRERGTKGGKIQIPRVT